MLSKNFTAYETMLNQNGWYMQRSCRNFVILPTVKERRDTISNPLDILGFTGSFLCALHCLALPLLISLGVIGHIHPSFAWDWILFGFLLSIACISLVSSYRQMHRDVRPLILAGLSICLIAVGELNHHTFGHLLAGIGGIGLAASHLLNWHIVRSITSSKSVKA